MKRSIILFALLCTVCHSCLKEALPESDLSLEGKWAALDGEKVVTENGTYGRSFCIVEFSAGTCYTYSTSEHHDVQNDTIYSCYSDDFVIVSSHGYYVGKDGDDRFLVVNGRNMGRISDVTEASIRIGDCDYLKVNSFSSEALRKLGSIKVDKSDRKHWREGGMILGDDEKTVVNLILQPETATDKEIDWMSSNPGIVSVSQNGLLHAVSGGYVTITASNKASGLKCSFNVSAEMDLAKEGTANCYLLTDSCYFYSFPAVGGFRGKNVDGIDHAEVLWVLSDEHYAADNIIDSLGVKDGKLYFTCTETKDWNALIAAKDGNGNILWSWHIWKSTGYDPDAETKAFHIDSRNPLRLMSRNLGAFSSEPDTLTADSGNTGLPGLLYQPGRKDPFPGRNGDTNAFDPSGEGQFTAAIAGEAKTTEWSVRNPMTVIYPISGFWCSDADYRGWAYDSKKKSCYDPCPPGWQVGEDKWWETPIVGRRDANGHNGVWFKSTADDGSEIWLETAGMVKDKTYGDSEPISEKTSGKYWLAPSDPTKTKMPMLDISENDGKWSAEIAMQTSMNYRASVRCMKTPIMQ